MNQFPSDHRNMTNKLALMVGYSELLLEDPRLPEEFRDYANVIFTTSLAVARAIHATNAPVS
jgi:hypothetical protein